MTAANGNGTALVVHGGAMPSGQEIDTAVRIATNLAQSGFFKDARQAQQAFAKIMLGRDLGLSPTQAMTSIHVVEGKPELSANLQAQLVKTYRGPDGERYDYRVLEHTDEACAVEFRRREPGSEWEVLGTERFTMDDAAKAGLAGKNVWKSYPRNMLWARCISNGVNFHCPEVARGLRLFTEGEAAEAPEVVDAPPVQAAEPVDAVIVEDHEHVERLESLAAEIVEAEVWTTRKLGTALRAAGATDTSSVGAAIRTLTPDQADTLANSMADALAAAEAKAA